MSADLRALSNLSRAASAGEGDLAALMPRLCASLAESFGLGRVDLVLPAEERANGLAEKAARAAGRPVCIDGELVVPLMGADSVVGFLVSDCADDPPPEPVDLLSVAG